MLFLWLMGSYSFSNSSSSGTSWGHHDSFLIVLAFFYWSCLWLFMNLFLEALVQLFCVNFSHIFLSQCVGYLTADTNLVPFYVISVKMGHWSTEINEYLFNKKINIINKQYRKPAFCLCVGLAFHIHVYWNKGSFLSPSFPFFIPSFLL